MKQILRVGYAAGLALAAGGGGAEAGTYNYIPASLALENLNSAGGGKICVVGSSQQQLATATVPSVPAYYLTSNAKKQGVWKQTKSSQTNISAMELGTDITSIAPSPAVSPPFINAAAVRFFALQGTGAPSCSSISYTFKDPITGSLQVTYNPYPSGLLEFSAYAKADLPGKGDTSYVLTIDTSNVDTFELPLTAVFAKGKTLQGAFGNAMAAAASTKTMITGATGGGTSPYARWLQQQPGYQSGVNAFAALALSNKGWQPANPSGSATGSYPYAMLQSPNDYLGAKCLPQGSTSAPWFVPAGCGLSGKLISWPGSRLLTYYDNELATFFANAVPGSSAPKGTKHLIVMGDAKGALTQVAWTASALTSCPMYLKPDAKSLKFTSSQGTVVVCNPVGQVFRMTGGTPTNYTQTGSAASIQITKAQYNAYKSLVGWNLGQVESGWIGNVNSFSTSTDASGATVYTINLTALAANSQTACPSGCLANPSFANWVFSNIAWSPTTSPLMLPSQMVFANAGVFAAPLTYTGDLQAVALSIQRNIVWAFSHGIANCNNVTMSGAAPQPTYCAGVKRLASKAYEAGAYGASDAYWSNEANWYPANGPQNYYAQYLHTARLTTSGTVVAGASCPSECFNIFMAPNGASSSVASSNQGIPMGMAYGFGFDENPDYLSGAVAQVPSKLDPISSTWGTGVTGTIYVGRVW